MKRAGDKIKMLRELRGLTQEEVARKLNLSAQAYSKIERNSTKLDIDRLQQIANILEVSADFITNFDDQQIFINSQNILGNAKMTNSHSPHLIETLERTIQEQKEEIKYLREQVSLLINKIGDSK